MFASGAAADNEADFKAAVGALQKGDFATAEKLATQLLDRTDIPPQGRTELLILRGTTRMSTGDQTGALSDLTVALPFSDKPNYIRYLRVFPEVELKQFAEAAEDVTALAQSDAMNLDELQPQKMREIVDGLTRTGDDMHLIAMLTALTNAGYKGPQPGVGRKFDRALILAYLRAGRTMDALAQARAVHGAWATVGMLVDLRYAALWDDPGFAADVRPDKLAARDVQSARDALHDDPKSLTAVLHVIQALRLAGKPYEAIAKARDTLAHQADYDENEEYRYWIMNELAYALLDTGKTEEGLDILRPLTALDLQKHGPAISQFINLGALLDLAGYFDEALTVTMKAEAADLSTPYGDMWIHANYVCAFAGLGRQAEAQAALAHMQELAAYNRSAWVEAELCLDNEDAVAAQLIGRLADPDTRGAALIALQNYREDGWALPLAHALHQRYRAVRERPDVQKAIADVGRVLSLPIVDTYWGDF